MSRFDLLTKSAIAQSHTLIAQSRTQQPLKQTLAIETSSSSKSDEHSNSNIDAKITVRSRTTRTCKRDNLTPTTDAQFSHYKIDARLYSSIHDTRVLVYPSRHQFVSSQDNKSTRGHSSPLSSTKAETKDDLELIVDLDTLWCICRMSACDLTSCEKLDTCKGFPVIRSNSTSPTDRLTYDRRT